MSSRTTTDALIKGLFVNWGLILIYDIVQLITPGTNYCDLNACNVIKSTILNECEMCKTFQRIFNSLH